MVRVYTETARGQAWLERYRGTSPLFACVFGFTETGTLPEISAAGRTPADRRKTALADAEYLLGGGTTPPHYPLPPLTAGASPAVISRAVIEGLSLPLYVFDAGLPAAIPQPSPLPTATVVERFPAVPARCLTTGAAMTATQVQDLFAAGLAWGDRLANHCDYAILGECVVGGTTTALAVLLALGIAAEGQVNSSYPLCNHQRKQDVVDEGLRRWRERGGDSGPFGVLQGLGDPMQVVVAGLGLALSRRCGVLLAGGTQMLAVYALLRAIAQELDYPWRPEQIVVGTTRWVAEDPTGQTVELAKTLGDVSLLATQLSFRQARFPQLRAYEAGYVKEGVGAGGCAIAASLQGWTASSLLAAIETGLSQLIG
ncbi:MAG: TIGR00303 family protein [Phormidium sp. BM_Day4_Bin.17]|nr:TIGR00303 family protein [Phormidium sp. BM_Day4_Bin.17]UCJ14169.1 MAG: TIGR00303 family protein [Phormidium sp. PBR-2020]